MSFDINFVQLNIGCLSRNKFWNESDTKAYRKAICTSTLVFLPDSTCMLVDPGLPYDVMREIIFNRCGLTIDRVKSIFLTHFHADHIVDIELYNECNVYASEKEISMLTNPLPIKSIEPLKNQIEGVYPVPLPGHTHGINGLGFTSNGLKVIVAGDAVMTKDFYIAEDGFNNSLDFSAVKTSIQYIRHNFDIVVPGHDVLFSSKVK